MQEESEARVGRAAEQPIEARHATRQNVEPQIELTEPERTSGSASEHCHECAHVFAALDLGSNNCRLLIAKRAADGFQVLDSFSRIVRLAEGVQASGRLSEAAMTRSVAALRVCAERMRGLGVTVARAVATEACRKAANGAVLLDRVRRNVGLRLDIIDSAEEARLAVLGCAPLFDPSHRHALLFDIGGGSTELAWLSLAAGVPPAPAASASLPIGVVGLAERWGGAEVTDETYAAMVAAVAAEIEPFERAHNLRARFADQPFQLLGTSGTVTTVAGVHFDLARYDRNVVDGVWLDFDAVKAATTRLRRMSYQERAAHPCVGRARADLVIAGCAIVEAVHQVWPADRLRVADRGVREGVLQSLLLAVRAGQCPASALL